MESPVEKLRVAWTPGQEVEEVVAELNPQTELDSMIRDWFFKLIDKLGPQTLILGMGDVPALNEGTLRWEIVHHAPKVGGAGRREVTIWVEK